MRPLFKSPADMNFKQLRRLLKEIKQESKDGCITGSELKPIMDSYFGESKVGIRGLAWLKRNGHLIIKGSACAIKNQVFSLNLKKPAASPPNITKKQQQTRRAFIKKDFSGPADMSPKQLSKLLQEIQEKSEDGRILGPDLKPIMDKYFGKSKSGVRGTTWMQDCNYLISDKHTPIKDRVFRLSPKSLTLMSLYSGEPCQLVTEQTINILLDIQSNTKKDRFTIKESQLKSVLEKYFGKSKRGLPGIGWMTEKGYLLPSNKDVKAKKKTFTLSLKSLFILHKHGNYSMHPQMVQMFEAVLEKKLSLQDWDIYKII